ncbi:hypothetical protein LLG95_08580 [bacterium]|nr:hypothetical protein [bacterium]
MKAIETSMTVPNRRNSFGHHFGHVQVLLTLMIIAVLVVMLGSSIDELRRGGVRPPKVPSEYFIPIIIMITAGFGVFAQGTFYDYVAKHKFVSAFSYLSVLAILWLIRWKLGTIRPTDQSTLLFFKLNVRAAMRLLGIPVVGLIAYGIGYGMYVVLNKFMIFMKFPKDEYYREILWMTVVAMTVAPFSFWLIMDMNSLFDGQIPPPRDLVFWFKYFDIGFVLFVAVLCGLFGGMATYAAIKRKFERP